MVLRCIVGRLIELGTRPTTRLRPVQRQHQLGQLSGVGIVRHRPPKASKPTEEIAGKPQADSRTNPTQSVTIVSRALNTPRPRPNPTSSLANSRSTSRRRVWRRMVAAELSPPCPPLTCEACAGTIQGVFVSWAARCCQLSGAFLACAGAITQLSNGRDPEASDCEAATAAADSEGGVGGCARKNTKATARHSRQRG
jgi:hypothetical protein